ncbi:hypothetical protein T440DRAFT_426776 [Plenodomus tracheiphilus IPT5]|uniref:Uncharacterized protein n=1 Tax=Plenodomus tracheiphilus IPT5 TaxID=1408161 RepID=A0A6A7B278_9PLEO|nr:hypothetical protein T440DRAFT_426776 [Plenodomus tracheiphilus IPT5]
MAFEASSPPHKYTPPKDETDAMLPSSPASTLHIRQESSDEDTPIMMHRKPPKHVDGTSQQERRSGRSTNDRERPASSKKAPAKPTVKKNGKTYKKPGPQPWASKPIMKNDMVAKKAVIREIECYWGKGFIRSYIPKCHRPLVKRGAHGKRPMNRAHETDPKKWLPSVLKAILMIAKLTNNKKWLKEAMNDVVRYRIRNTGNRKPQLVTTDFDVIEDMLVKDWAVDYAFEIRYKHLLVNRKDQQETDEDIDHILQVAEDDGDDGSDGDWGDEDDDMGKLEGELDDDDDDDEEEEFEQGYGGISDKYQQSSGYTKADRHSPAPLSRQQHMKDDQSKLSRIKSEPASTPPMERLRRGQNSYMHGHTMPGYGGPLMSPWGAPMPPPYGGYGSFPGYSGYQGYSHPHFPNRERSQHQNPYTMYPPPHHMTSMPGHHYQQPPFGNNQVSGNGYGMEPAGLRTLTPSSARQGSAHPKIKRESPGYDEPIMSVGEFNGPQNAVGATMNDEDEDVDGELEAVELELKLARLRAKKAAQSKGR